MKSVVYHGSPTGDIKEIKAHISTHEKNVFMQQTIKLLQCYLWVAVWEIWILF